MGTFAVIVPAAGRSAQLGDPRQKKIYADLDGRAVWLRAIEPFLNREDVAQIVVAIAAEDRELFERRYRPSVAFLNIKVIEGGAERVDSVARALAEVDASCDHIAIHDAARPCLPPALISAVFAAAVADGAALPGVAVADTLKRVGADRKTIETVSRDGLFAVQTPQAFRRDLLERAHANRPNLDVPITDDAQLVEALGHPCTIVDGSPFNLKITTQGDLALARAILPLLEPPAREGPSHPFAQDNAPWATGPVPKVTDLFGE